MAARPIAVSLGDPAGIGPEIVARAWQARQDPALPLFFAIGAPEALIASGAIDACAIALIDDPNQVSAHFDTRLPLLPLRADRPIEPGRPDVAGARLALDALNCAIGLTRAGASAALVTAPVSKAQLNAAGFSAPGQTEKVARACGVADADAVMMLAGPGLKVVPLTTHIALSAVPTALTEDLLMRKARITAAALRRDFGIAAPRLAVAALNPHAGEQGAMGDEDDHILAPAIARLRADGLDITGPHPADTLFHPRARARYDVALCAYHDQALIPLKTLYFDEGVNITLGLPLVRTSPDHGTAFDIAGQGLAHPEAMIAAIRMAAHIAERRNREP